MKAIIEVEEFDKCFKFIGDSGHEVWFNKDEIEIIKEQEPKKLQRTHQEIMTNWFKYDDTWKKVLAYSFTQNFKYAMIFRGEIIYYHKDFFDSLEMSELPPEEANE